MSEYLDIVDERGIPTGEIVERKKAHREGIRHRTAHLWICRIHDGTLQLLLQKRSADKDSFPGCYDISSAGHIPAGVEWIPSALRELKEELGIDARPEQLILCGQRSFHLDEVFYGERFIDEQVTNVYMMWLDLPESAFTPQPEEVSEVKWFDCSEVLSSRLNPEFPNCIVPEEVLLVRGTANVKSPRNGD